MTLYVLDYGMCQKVGCANSSCCQKAFFSFEPLVSAMPILWDCQIFEIQHMPFHSLALEPKKLLIQMSKYEESIDPLSIENQPSSEQHREIRQRSQQL